MQDYQNFHLKRRFGAGLLILFVMIVIQKFDYSLPTVMQFWLTSPLLLGLLVTVSVWWVGWPIIAISGNGLKTGIIMPQLLWASALLLGYCQVLGAVFFPLQLAGMGIVNDPPYLFLSLAPTLMIGQLLLMRTLSKHLPREGVDRSVQYQKALRRSSHLTYLTLLLALASLVVNILIIHLPVSEAITIALSVLTGSSVISYLWLIALPLSEALKTAGIHKIRFKGGEVFERLHKINVIIFTLLGTITQGNPEIVDIRAARPKELLVLAYSLEQGYDHPLARAIINAAKKQNVEPFPVTAVEYYPGMGVVGMINNRRIALGNMELMKQEGVVVGVLQREKHRIEDNGQTVLVLGVSERGERRDRHPGEVLGLLVLQDKLRPAIKNTIVNLMGIGVKPWLISGDSLHTVEALAKKIVLNPKNIIAQCLPQEKPEQIAKLARKYSLALVGNEWINRQLYAAGVVSIELTDNNHATPSQLDIVLTSDQLLLVGDAIGLARLTQKIINRNLWLNFYYNCLAYPLILGFLLLTPWQMLIDPVWAISASTLVTLVIIGNSWLVGRWRYKN